MATMTVRVASINTALLDVFREETTDGLDQLEAKLLALLSPRDPELIDQLFRVVHTIKGGAGTFGMIQMTRLAHRMESVLDIYRGGAEPTRSAVTTLLEAGDALRRLLGGGPSVPDQEAALEARLEHAATQAASVGRVLPAASGDTSGARAAQVSSTGVPAPDMPAPAADGLSPAMAAVPEAVAPELRPLALHTIQVSPARELFRAGVDPVVLFDQLSSLGELSATVDVASVPQFEELDPTTCHLGWTLRLVGGDAEIVHALFDWVDDICPITIETLGGAPATCDPSPDHEPPCDPAPPLAAPAVRAAVAASPGNRDAAAATIRVRLDKLDALMALVGDLVVTQSTLCTLDRGGRGAVDPLRSRAALDDLQRLTRSLQQSALQLRSMPISSVLDRFPRLVHDLAERLGKDIVLEIGGDGIELDKTVLERIGDPLVHLIRNSIDHGIELPEAREAAGKSRTGRIQIAVEQRGDEVAIEISDDGRGLDAARIAARAAERGLIAPGHSLSEDEIYRLIFVPGFSTADQVSELSGRGVGMDVVVRTIQELGGDVRLRSELGAGTTIALRLPLTLAIVEGQLIRFGGRTWIVPLLHVVECSRLDPAAVTMLGQRAVYRVGDDVAPLIDLCERMAVPRTVPGTLVLVVEAGGRQRALVIDEVGPRQQVVVKSLSAQLARVDDLAGATVLGDGSVAFILDIVGLCAKGVAR